MKLELDLERTDLRPGDVVTGAVRVVYGGGSRSLTVALLQRDGSSSLVEVVRELPAAAPLHEGRLEGGSSHPFSIPLPADAVPSLDTPHGRIWWEVQARSDQLGPDSYARAELTVVSRR